MWLGHRAQSSEQVRDDGGMRRRMIAGFSTMPGANVLNIRECRTRLTRREPKEQTSPLEIATAPDGAAAQTIDITALTEKAAADIEMARDWKPGTLKDDGKRGGTEKGFRQ